MSRKLAETEVPIMEPILLKVVNLWLMAEAVAAMIMEVVITILWGKTGRGIRDRVGRVILRERV